MPRDNPEPEFASNTPEALAHLPPYEPWAPRAFPLPDGFPQLDGRPAPLLYPYEPLTMEGVQGPRRAARGARVRPAVRRGRAPASPLQVYGTLPMRIVERARSGSVRSGLGSSPVDSEDSDGPWASLLIAMSEDDDDEEFDPAILLCLPAPPPSPSSSSPGYWTALTSFFNAVIAWVRRLFARRSETDLESQGVE